MLFQSGNEDITGGYKVRLDFDTILPDDIEFETFVRTQCVGVKRFPERNATTVMFQSTVDYAEIDDREHFPFSFVIKSTRGYHHKSTNVAEFLKKNDCKCPTFWKFFSQSLILPIGVSNCERPEMSRKNSKEPIQNFSPK